jgi:hypothetical protein
MVAVPVDSGWGKDGGEAVQELEGRETERGTAGGIRFGEQVENLVGAAVDEVKTIESKGRPGTITDEAFEPLPVRSLYTDAGIEAEPAAMIPAEHVLSLVGFQESVTAKVA